MEGGITLFDVLSKTMALVLSFPVYEGWSFLVLNWLYDLSLSTLLGLQSTEREREREREREIFTCFIKEMFSFYINI